MTGINLLACGLALQAASINKSTGDTMGRIKRGSGSFETTITNIEGEDVEIEVRYKGYSDPGCTYGDPNDCWEPESDIEIEVFAADGTPLTVGTDEQFARLEELAYEHLQEDH